MAPDHQVGAFGSNRAPWMSWGKPVTQAWSSVSTVGRCPRWPRSTDVMAEPCTRQPGELCGVTSR